MIALSRFGLSVESAEMPVTKYLPKEHKKGELREKILFVDEMSRAEFLRALHSRYEKIQNAERVAYYSIPAYRSGIVDLSEQPDRRDGKKFRGVLTGYHQWLLASVLEIFHQTEQWIPKSRVTDRWVATAKSVEQNTEAGKFDRSVFARYCAQQELVISVRKR